MATWAQMMENQALQSAGRAPRQFAPQPGQRQPGPQQRIPGGGGGVNPLTRAIAGPGVRQMPGNLGVNGPGMQKPMQMPGQGMMQAPGQGKGGFGGGGGQPETPYGMYGQQSPLQSMTMEGRVDPTTGMVHNSAAPGWNPDGSFQPGQGIPPEMNTGWSKPKGGFGGGQMPQQRDPRMLAK